MPKKNATARSKKPARTPAAGPVQERQLERWLDSDWSRWGKFQSVVVEKRLYSIAPTFVAICSELSISGMKKEAAAVATQALGTIDPTSYRRDGKRVNVLVDWSVRCALPQVLHSVPNWCVPAAEIARLRDLRPLLYPDAMVFALDAMLPLLVAISKNDAGTGVELRALAAAYTAITRSMHAVSDLLSRQLAHNDPRAASSRDNDTYECKEALGFGVGLTAAARAGLPELVTVLLQVQPGDSQRSVAARCVWSKPKQRHQAA